MLCQLVEARKVGRLAVLVCAADVVVCVSLYRRHATSTGPAVAHRPMESSQWRCWERRISKDSL